MPSLPRVQFVVVFAAKPLNIQRLAVVVMVSVYVLTRSTNFTGLLYNFPGFNSVLYRSSRSIFLGVLNPKFLIALALS